MQLVMKNCFIRLSDSLDINIERHRQNPLYLLKPSPAVTFVTASALEHVARNVVAGVYFTIAINSCGSPGMIRWSQFQFPFIRVPRQPSAASELVVALVSSSSADEKSYAMRWFEPLQTGVECHTSYMHSSIPWRNTTYPSTMLR
jgi:hypothetical protein